VPNHAAATHAGEPDAQLLVRVHKDARGECDTVHSGRWPRCAALRIRGWGGKCSSRIIGREQLSESSVRKRTYRVPRREYGIEPRAHRRCVPCRRIHVRVRFTPRLLFPGRRAENPAAAARARVAGARRARAPPVVLAEAAGTLAGARAQDLRGQTGQADVRTGREKRGGPVFGRDCSFTSSSAPSSIPIKIVAEEGTGVPH
jgi:hypothetical protein